MRSRLQTPHGRARITRESAQLVAIAADSELAAYYAQGYAAGALRLWQLELTRRVAAGELAALLGNRAVATDRFQRDLGLRELARRELARDAGTAQVRHVQAYVDGVNHAIAELRAPPIELALLGHRASAFTVEDVYLVAQLKYFLNSGWRFELLHTLAAGRLDAVRAAQLFTTFALDGTTLEPLPRAIDGQLAEDAAAALAAGLAGLELLGMDSPDIGSNAFALAGTRTASGYPLLATDPHMGNVNPGYNLMCKLVTDDGLAVVGSHFPGAPGIVIGRNRDCGWGMVGLMADNQDLLVGAIDLGDRSVRVHGRWLQLECTRSVIEVRGGRHVEHMAYGFAHGRLVVARGHRGLFLRWPALDMPIGGVCLSELARAHDWGSYRRGVARMTNSPQLSVYADRYGHIGLQAIGYLPRRRRAIGSIVLSLDDVTHAWDGYVAFDELPSALDPEAGWIAYANEYCTRTFGDRPHISNRWHPPTRARRIAELIARRSRHDAASLQAIQDDRVDAFARDQLSYLVSLLPGSCALAGWNGDTRDTTCALLFDRWMSAILDEVTISALPPALAEHYADLWPGHRWNVLAILRDHATTWQLDARAIVTRAYARAITRHGDTPYVELRHTLRRHPLGKLAFTARYRYDGGARETIHAARRNVDFLTASQAGGRSDDSFHFGPAFKLVYDFSPAGETHYLSSTPASGLPLGIALAPTLRRWRRGRRYRTRLW
jgi:penicillin amidase